MLLVVPLVQTEQQAQLAERADCVVAMQQPQPIRRQWAGQTARAQLQQFVQAQQLAWAFLLRLGEQRAQSVQQRARLA